MGGSDDLLKNLLRSVSRSFYLTLRVLPCSIRPQISLAYLLARATDTIADTDVVPIERRMGALALYRERILGLSNKQIALDDFSSAGQGSTSRPEKVLLFRMEEALALLERLPAEDQKRIRDVIAIIVSGQELDLQRFGCADSHNIVALKTDAELDDYTWRVAGCVGEFWTHTCRAHLFAGYAGPERAALHAPSFLSNGVRFGKGLQLVNILRDVPADLRKGRCYLPVEMLAGAGLKPQELLDVSAENAARSVYDGYLSMADGHLLAGWQYTNAIPRKFVRLRLACAWPILIGVKTLARLREASFLDPAQRTKVSRPEVRAILGQTIVAMAWPRAWQRLFDRAAWRPAKGS
jgi:farnesyl-diphosphate farnesyltransferase